MKVTPSPIGDRPRPASPRLAHRSRHACPRASRTLSAIAVVAAACSAAARHHEVHQTARFEAGLDPSVYVRFRGTTYAEEPEIEELAPEPQLVEEPLQGRPTAAGRHALRLDIPAHGRVLVHTPALAIRDVVTLSAWLRSEPPQRVTLRLFRSLPSKGTAYGARQQELTAREVEVGASWSRVEVQAAAAGEGVVYGQVEMAGPRTLLLDALSLLDGSGDPPAEPSGAEPLEVVLSVLDAPSPAPRGAALLVPDVPVPGVVEAGREARVRVLTSRPLDPMERMTARLLAADGSARALPVAPPSAGSRELVLPPLANGPHLVEVEVTRGGQREARALRSLVVLPPAPRTTLGESRLGTHTRLDARHLATAARLGLRWMRLHDASMVGQWITVEPTPGARRYFDRSVDLAASRGFGILGVLEATPRWASAAPANTGWYEARAYPPRQGAALSAYVAAVTAHYRGRIDGWEVWNEPYLPDFFRGTPVDYGDLLERALGAAHPATPTAWLLASAAPEGERAAWTRSALATLAEPPRIRRGRGRSALRPDGYAFHPYDDRLVRPPSRLSGSLATLRSMVADPPGAGAPPLWATEGAVLGAAGATLDPESAMPGAASVDAAASAQVAWAVDLLAGGAERVFVYQLVESPYRNDADLSLLEPDGTPRPAAAALAVLASRIAGRRVTRQGGTTNGVQVTLWSAPSTASTGAGLAVCYRGDGAPFPVSGGDAQWTDVWGNPLAPGASVRLAYASGSERELGLIRP